MIRTTTNKHGQTILDMAVASALAKIRKAFKEAGWPMGKVLGRYYAFGPSQTVIRGISVSRVGCSETIALHWKTPDHNESHKEHERKAIEFLRALGFPVQDNGFIDCRYY